MLALSSAKRGQLRQITSGGCLASDATSGLQAPPAPDGILRRRRAPSGRTRLPALLLLDDRRQHAPRTVVNADRTRGEASLALGRYISSWRPRPQSPAASDPGPAPGGRTREIARWRAIVPRVWSRAGGSTAQASSAQPTRRDRAAARSRLSCPRTVAAASTIVTRRAPSLARKSRDFIFSSDRR